MHFNQPILPGCAMQTKLLATTQPAFAPLTKKITLPEHQDKRGGNGVILADTVDINTADSTVLEQLIGIGPVTAHNILRRRLEKGPFTTADQLREVGSFSMETLDILNRHLRFSPSAQ